MKKSIVKYLLLFSVMSIVALGFNSCSPKYGCPSLEGQADIKAGKTPESSSGLFPEGGKKGKKRNKRNK